MSFGQSPHCSVRAVRVSNVSGWSLLMTLISPLIAVCLGEYLHTHEKQQTTFAVPIPSSEAGRPEDRLSAPRLESTTVASVPSNGVELRHAFAVEPEKQARAESLIGRANEAQGDPAGQFALLRRAKDIATQAGDANAAFQAIDAMADAFHIDADAMKLAVLAKFAAIAKKPAQHKSIAAQALQRADQAVGHDHFMVANQLGKLALAEAKRAADMELTAQAQSAITNVAERVKAKERLCSASCVSGNSDR
jgi:hypothetical protein